MIICRQRPLIYSTYALCCEPNLCGEVKSFFSWKPMVCHTQFVALRLSRETHILAETSKERSGFLTTWKYSSREIKSLSHYSLFTQKDKNNISLAFTLIFVVVCSCCIAQVWNGFVVLMDASLENLSHRSIKHFISRPLITSVKLCSNRILRLPFKPMLII